jgi:hypothetical protein
MKRWIRALATVVIALTVVAQAAPAAATARDFEDRGRVNILFDIMVLRPLGFAATALGSALFAIPVAPIMAITRPQEMRKPLEFLVLRPARYTFSDPIGHH